MVNGFCGETVNGEGWMCYGLNSIPGIHHHRHPSLYYMPPLMIFLMNDIDLCIFVAYFSIPWYAIHLCSSSCCMMTVMLLLDSQLLYFLRRYPLRLPREYKVISTFVVIVIDGIYCHLMHATIVDHWLVCWFHSCMWYDQ
jgi:hypothetical protein